MDINRKTAFETLCEIEDKNAYSNLAVNKYIKKNNPDKQSFVRGLVYGVLENRKLLDMIVEQYVGPQVSKMKTKPLVALRLGLYQLIFMDNVPDYAAINETVQVVKKMSYGHYNFVNAILRKFIRGEKKYVLPDPKENIIAYLSMKYSYDESIVKLWNKDYGTHLTEEMMQVGNEVPPLTIRVNKLKTTRESLKSELEDNGFLAELSENSDVCLHVKGTSILQSESFLNGLFSVQDESSVIAVNVLAPKPGDTVIDVCSAPGGKSTYMAELMGNKGKIFSWDVHPHKLFLIDEHAERLGIDIIETAVYDSVITEESLIGEADRVLVDAPCLGLGVIRRKPEIKYKNIDSLIRGILETQLKLLIASAPYVKKGGRLMYSTCSVSNRENGHIIRTFLNVYTDFKIIEENQILPGNKDMDGFYYCCLQRI